MVAGEAQIDVNAEPAAVYAVVSDITRTGEWSPECERAEWLDDADGPAPGARFRGHNKQGAREWVMDAVVDVAEAPHAFAFHTERDGAVRTRWGYRIDPGADSGTTLTEWYERVVVVPMRVRIGERLLMGGRQKHNDANLRASLARIKAIVEHLAG